MIFLLWANDVLHFMLFTELSRANHVKVNPKQNSSFTCYIEGIIPADENDINLYRLVNDTYYDETGISRSEVIPLDGEEYAVSFTASAVQGEVYACSLKNMSKEYLKLVNAITYGEYIAFHFIALCSICVYLNVMIGTCAKLSLYVSFNFPL